MEYGSRKKPGTEDAIARLKQLKDGFTAAAAENQRKADDAAVALSVLEDAQRREEENRKARFRQRIEVQAAYIKSLLAHEKKPHAFAVFVDHTGSMTEKPFNAALDGAGVLVNATSAQAALWGSHEDVRWIKGDILDPDTRKSFDKKGASSDFKPVADEMIKLAALNKIDGKASHFVIISDGEFSDYPKAKAQIEKLLKGHFRATVDFIVLARAGTGMEFLSQQLEKDFPGKVAHHLVNGPAYWQGTEEDLSKAVQETVAKAATARIRPAPRPKAKPQPAA